MVGAVIATLAIRPAHSGPRPGPLWETKAAGDCGYPGQGATWDDGEATRVFAVFGDSVLGQAAAAAIAIAGQRCHTMTSHARSGGAPCDALAGYEATVVAEAPSRVVLSWVGNVGASPCMVAVMAAAFGAARWTGHGPGTLTPEEINYAGLVYETDLRKMVRIDLAHNVQTVLVMPPPMRAGTYHRQMQAQLLSRYQEIGDSYGGVWADRTGRDLLGGETWQEFRDGHRLRKACPDCTHLQAPSGTWLWADGLVTAGVL